MRTKITRADITNIGSAVVGAILWNTGTPTVQTIGGYLFAGSAIIGLYRIYKKAKAEKKEMLFI